MWFANSNYASQGFQIPTQTSLCMRIIETDVTFDECFTPKEIFDKKWRATRQSHDYKKH